MMEDKQSFTKERVKNFIKSHWVAAPILACLILLVPVIYLYSGSPPETEVQVYKGSTISYGSEYVFNSGDTGSISAATLDSTHAIIAYEDYENGEYGIARVTTISGSTISYGSEYVFNSNFFFSLWIVAVIIIVCIVGAGIALAVRRAFRLLKKKKEM